MKSLKNVLLVSVKLMKLCVPLCAIFLSACATDVVTGRSAYNLFSVDEDVKMGNSYMKDINKEMSKAKVRTIDSGAQADQIKEIMENLSAVCHRPNLPYRVTIFDTNIVNAAALPGGEMMVFRGLYDGTNALCLDKDEMAAVMAHEMAHVNCRHSTEELSKTITAGAIVEVVALGMEAKDKDDYADIVRGAFWVGTLFVIPKYSRVQEEEADKIGLKYMAMAGYDPRASVRLWKRAAEQEKKEGGSKTVGKILSVFNTHPDSARRAKYLEAELPQVMAIYEEAKLNGK